MTDKKENGWIKFVPSLDLPKERVSIAYDINDERGVRFAYGYFQFYNGTCGCFWKDGNEQPKVVKLEDIKYWMPVPSLDVQEEPVSEDLEKEFDDIYYQLEKVDAQNDGFGGRYKGYKFALKIARHFAKWQKEQMMAKAVDGVVHHFEKCGVASVHYTDPTGVPMAYFTSPEGLSAGDKVKIIVIKED